ncbi:MAG: TonB-dependent receptor [Akkermansiaceae bacterium]|nr:TonB-dependent receptor [Akkermansiaceae bacterium]
MNTISVIHRGTRTTVRTVNEMNRIECPACDPIRRYWPCGLTRGSDGRAVLWESGVALISLLLLSGHSVPAATPDAPTTLPALIVKAARDQPATGTGGTEALASITPLDPTSERLSELFQRVPGLIAQDSFGGFDPPRLAVRGSGIQSAPTSRGLLISFFEMPLNAADGSFNLTLLESSWMESARLIRGPAAGVPALGGSLTLGRAADAFAPGWSAGAAYGSDNTLTLSARGAQPVNGVDLAGRAVFNHTDGWRPHSWQERASIFAAARTALADDTDLTIQFFGSRPSYEVPGPLTKQAALTDPESIIGRVILDRPRRETEYAQLSARVSKRWSDGRASLAVGGVSHRDTFYQLLPNGVGTTEALEAYLAFNAEKNWNPGGHQTRFSTLLQAGWWDACHYRSDRGEKGAIIGSQRLQPVTLTAAIDHRWTLPANQQLEVGGSLLSANRDIDDRLPPVPGTPSVDLSLSDTCFAPRAAWSWSPLEDTTFTVSWARSYEPPTYNDLFYTTGPMNARVLRSSPLEWQQADSFEIGAHGRWDRLAWSSSIYYAPWQNEFLRLVDGTGSPLGTVNANRTIHSGFESAVEWDLLPDATTDLTAWATYNYTDARFDNDPVYGNRRLAGIPPHTGALGLRAVSPGGWFIAPAFQWGPGDTYGDHAHGISYGSAGLWSLEIGRRHPDGWSVSLGIHNLFDSHTIASTAGVLDRVPAGANPTIFLPAAGRTVELRFESTW